MRGRAAIVVLLLLPFCRCSAQQQPFAVSPLVGDTVDLAERDRYLLFPGVEDFHSAVFHVHPDSTLTATLRTERGGVVRDTMIAVTRSLHHLRSQIAALHERWERSAGESPGDTILGQDETWRDVQGALVSVTGKQEWTRSGELLSVRDDCILLALGKDGWPMRYGPRPEIVRLPLCDIAGIHMAAGRSTIAPVVLGLIGGMLGVAIAVATQRDDGRDPRSPWFIVGFGAFAGVVFGIVVGANVPRGPRVSLRFQSAGDRSFLRSHARYQHGEPPFLRTMFP